MTPDLSEFEETRTCLAAKKLAELDPDDHAKFTAALAAEHIRTTKIVERLQARGIRIGRDAVGRHRTGDCCCD